MIQTLIKRPLVTNILMLLILCAGWFVWNNIHREARPNVDFDRQSITTIFPGGSPEDVELYVTAPLEREIEKVSGVELITSQSREGVSSIAVKIDPDTSDTEWVKDEIQKAIDRVRTLPGDIEDKPVVFDYNTREFSILFVALVNQRSRLLTEQQRLELQAMFRNLEAQILDLPEISRAPSLGYREEEIRIEVDLQSLNTHYLSLLDVVKVLRENNVRQAAGSVEQTGHDKVHVITVGELIDPKVISELRLRSTFDGSGFVTLGDVAKVYRGFEKEQTKLKINGYEGMALKLTKSATVDGLDADDKVKELVKRFQTEVLKDTPYQLFLYKDRSIDTRNKIQIVSANAILGLLLVLLVLFLFLDVHTAFWTALGLPVSLSLALIMAYAMGFTLNNMTLAGIIIVMGMVVDDAIVIAENVYRHMQKGMDSIQSAFQGVAPMIKPVFASSLTTVLAFAPMYLFPGVIGKFISYVPLMVILVLCASFVEAVFLLPSHLAHPMKFMKPKSQERAWFIKCEDLYRALLLKVFTWKKSVIVLFMMALLGSVFWAKGHLKFVLFPSDEVTEIKFYAETDPGTSREDSARAIEKMEDLIKPYLDQGVKSYVTSIAQNRWGRPVDSNKILIVIELVPRDLREWKADQYIEVWEEGMKPFDSLLKKRFSKQRWGPSGGQEIEFVLTSNDNEQREEAARLMINSLKAMKGIHDVESDAVKQEIEWNIAIDHVAASRLRVSPANISLLVRAMFEGVIATRVYQADDELRYRVIASSTFHLNDRFIEHLTVRNQDGKLIPLEHVVRIDKGEHAQTISRRNGKRQITIEAKIKDENLTAWDVMTEVKKSVLPKMRQKYPSVLVEEEGELKDTREMRSKMIQALLLTLLLIYAVLVIVFNSLLRPFVILLSIPFGIIGVLWALPLHGMNEIGLFTGIGIIGLMGVVVNDSIVMVNRLNEVFDQNQSLSMEKMANVCVSRLRAIMLTTLTTCAGLFPTAYGWGGFDALVSEMTLAMSWGLLFATAVTLILVPCIYATLLKGVKS